jgi:hypothetical protein
LNNRDLKVMIQWFKRDADKVMPKNKEGLLICYRETHTHVLQGTNPYEDVATAAAVAASTSASHSAHSQPSCKTFDVAAAGTVVTIATAGVAIDSALAHGATSDPQPITPSNALSSRLGKRSSL